MRSNGGSSAGSSLGRMQSAGGSSMKFMNASSMRFSKMGNFGRGAIGNGMNDGEMTEMVAQILDQKMKTIQIAFEKKIKEDKFFTQENA